MTFLSDYHALKNRYKDHPVLNFLLPDYNNNPWIVYICNHCARIKYTRLYRLITRFIFAVSPRKMHI